MLSRISKGSGFKKKKKKRPLDQQGYTEKCTITANVPKTGAKCHFALSVKIALYTKISGLIQYIN